MYFQLHFRYYFRLHFRYYFWIHFRSHYVQWHFWYYFRLHFWMYFQLHSMTISGYTPGTASGQSSGTTSSCTSSTTSGCTSGTISGFPSGCSSYTTYIPLIISNNNNHCNILKVLCFIIDREGREIMHLVTSVRLSVHPSVRLCVCGYVCPSKRQLPSSLKQGVVNTGPRVLSVCL